MITISQKNYYLYFGIIAGLVFTVLLELEYSVLKNANGLSMVLSITSHYLLLFFTVGYFRNKYTNGYMTFGDAFGKGVILTIIGGIIAGIINYFLLKVRPGLVEDMKITAEETYLNLGWDAERIELSMKFLTPTIISISLFFRILFRGLIFGLLAANRIKRVQNPLKLDDQNNNQ